MSISVTCASCHRVIRAKEEYAGKRVRCPGCQSPVTIPAPREAPADLLDLTEEFPADPPSAPLSRPAAVPRTDSGKKSAAGTSWYVRHWHWLVVLAVLVLAMLPTVGFVIAGLVFLVGMGMAFIGGLVPIVRIIAGAPGTVLLLIVSRSARFDMMRQPDDHPYKVLVRNASKPTRGLLWRGVLLMVVFVPAARLHGLGTEVFRHLASRDSGEVPVPPDQSWSGRMPPGGPIMDRQPAVPPSGSPAGLGPIPTQAMGQSPSNAAAEQTSSGDSEPSSTPFPGGPNFGPQGQPPRFGGPGPQPSFGGPGPRSVLPGIEDRILLISMSFDASGVSGVPAEILESAVRELPGYVPETFSMEEGADRAEFRHRGEFNPRDMMRTMSANGFRGMRAQALPAP